MKWWEATAHLKRTPLLWSLGFKTPRIKLPSCSRARLDRPSEAPVSRSCQNSLVAPCRSSHSWDDKFCRDKIPSGYQKLRLNPLNGGSNRKIICVYIYVCIYIMHVCVYIYAYIAMFGYRREIFKSSIFLGCQTHGLETHHLIPRFSPIFTLSINKRPSSLTHQGNMTHENQDATMGTPTMILHVL